LRAAPTAWRPTATNTRPFAYAYDDCQYLSLSLRSTYGVEVDGAASAALSRCRLWDHAAAAAVVWASEGAVAARLEMTGCEVKGAATEAVAAEAAAAVVCVRVCDCVYGKRCCDRNPGLPSSLPFILQSPRGCHIHHAATKTRGFRSFSNALMHSPPLN
jgi:hypothetical protein